MDNQFDPQKAIMDYLSELLPASKNTIQEAPAHSSSQTTQNISIQAESDVPHFQAEPPLDKPVHSSSMPLSAEDSLLYNSRNQSIAAQRQKEKRKQWQDQRLPVREPIALNPADILPKPLPSLLKVAPEPKTTQSEQEIITPELEAKRKARSEKARANHLARIAARKQKVEGNKAEPIKAKIETVKKTTEESVPQASLNTLDGWLSNGRPDWGQARFECLLFTVAGLKLAVPLVTLGAIHTIDKELTPIVGRQAWYLGMFPVHERNVNVVDTARFIMPDRIQAGSHEAYNYAIRLDASDWGMGCHTVEQSIRLSPDDVKWRSNRGKRPWLAGTVVEYMCALIDVRALCRMFDESAIKRR
jgi:purine-binding chemotaxis protein CheW